MITHRQIEAFRSIMMSGTATQAAKMMHISQPAVSRMISSLEYEIGFSLFVRKNRQLLPTYEAQLFYDDVEQSFLGLDRLTKSAVAIRRGTAGNVRLICIPSIATNIMVDLIARFSQVKPEIAVSLEVQPSQRFFEWIVTHKCHLGLTTLPLDNPAIAIDVVATGDAVCIMPPNHPLAGKDEIVLGDLEGMSFIDYKTDSDFRQHMDVLFEKAKVRRKINYEARTTEVVVAMVGAGLGLSIVEPSFSKQADRQNVVSKPFSPSVPVELAVITSTLKPLTSAAENLLNTIKNHFQSCAAADR